MNESLLTKIRNRLSPRLDPTKPTGILAAKELQTIFALYQVLSGDEGVSRNEVLDFVNQRTKTVPGVLHAYRNGIALIHKRSRDFAQITMDERNAVLHKLLRSYRHPGLEPSWRRTLRLTPVVMDRLLAPQTVQSFRDLVVRDLLARYFTSARGWKLVGYEEFSGHVRTLDEPCEVRRVEFEGDDIILTLSDATVEVLADTGLQLAEDGLLRAITKWGRQTATFSHQTHAMLGERLEEDDSGFIVRVGNKKYQVADAGE